VREALQFFAQAPKIADKLRVLEEVGLGYLRLGQSATTLSGGEAQRIKLAAHLQGKVRETPKNAEEARKRPRTLYIFDEPTTGLHFDDVSNLDVIKTADWVIDLGPEGGERGGRVVAAGPPEVIARNAKSYTGKWLARILGNNGNRGSDRETTLPAARAASTPGRARTALSGESGARRAEANGRA